MIYISMDISSIIGFLLVEVMRVEIYSFYLFLIFSERPVEMFKSG